MTRHLHTKGLWTAHFGSDPDCNGTRDDKTTFRYFPHVKIGMRGSRRDQLTLNVGGGPMTEHDANCCLVAAAPKMLAALENLENDANQIPAHAWKLIQEALDAAYAYERPQA